MSYPPPHQSPSFPAAPGYPAGGFPAPAPKRPGILVVVLVTLFTGLIGLIPARIQHDKARRTGLPVARYWVAFLISFVINAAVWITVIFLVAIAGAAAARETNEQLLEDSIHAENDFGPGETRLALTSVDCETGSTHDRGKGDYDCVVRTSDGRQTTYRIRVNGQGRWSVAN